MSKTTRRVKTANRTRLTSDNRSIDLAPGTMVLEGNYDFADLSGVDLSGAFIVGGSFVSANFDGANLSSIRTAGSGQADRPNFSGASFVGANLSNAVIDRCTLSGTNMRKAIMSRASLRRANLVGADLSLADATGSDFRMADLSKSTCSGANFTGVRTKETNLSEIVAEGTDFSFAKLYESNMRGANFHGASFTEATLAKNYLHGAILSRIVANKAVFDDNEGIHEANWKNADLYESVWTTRDKVKWESGTLCPRGWEVSPSGLARLDRECVYRRARAHGLDGDLTRTIYVDHPELTFEGAIEIVIAMTSARRG